MPLKQTSRQTSKAKITTKRGDTIIEIMLALAIFAMVAITAVLIMNSGIAASERSLELVTARNELNAQAEALRFIHSSYVAELTLPKCSNAEAGQQCQQFDGLWSDITRGARSSANNTGDPNHYSIPSDITNCHEIYESRGGSNLLVQNNAFVVNTRILKSDRRTGTTDNSQQAIVRASNSNHVFVEPQLGARLIYGSNSSYNSNNNSTTNMTDSGLSQYRHLALAEGIWVVAVQGEDGHYYDFHINTCWYGAGASAPTTLDAVVRLYNPEVR